VGGNVEVARLSGLRTDRVLIGAHILCSMTAVLTGLFFSKQAVGAPGWADGLYDWDLSLQPWWVELLLPGGKGGVLSPVF
jgi:ribose transport system permease protein